MTSEVHCMYVAVLIFCNDENLSVMKCNTTIYINIRQIVSNK